jgi:hypothetical protein
MHPLPLLVFPADTMFQKKGTCEKKLKELQIVIHHNWSGFLEELL